MNDSKNKSDLPWYRIIGTVSLTTIVFLGVQMLLPFPYGLFSAFISFFVIPWLFVKKMLNHRTKSFVIIIALSAFISAIVLSYVTTQSGRF